MPANLLTNLLASDRHDLLNIYFTAGYPKLEDTNEIIAALEQAGADIIELGIPFSDPLADGPVIQKSSMQAIQNGMTLQTLFTQLRKSKHNIPIVLMGYVNSVLQYGPERFCKVCEDAGVAGLILPDLPIECFIRDYKALFETHNLLSIFLVTNRTSAERIKLLDHHTTGFLYAVSSASTTGTKKFGDESVDFLERLESMDLEHAVLTGFNIRDAASFKSACSHSRGGIIGSAFIKHLEHSSDLTKDTIEFIQTIRNHDHTT